ncbi:RibD family protein [Paenibacillus urinalis]|uniref:RibD family protein n=1 Tax=Paenibacillus urinalis TaxID=521520 RepID=A0ABY7X418_9BACL|nr:RibD family protein [Paenibacillus urinalis]WDH96620.1 RibD family protein [Paenibacillus urinalis]WDI00264.1 RibD family protein [Paenibacillus urinalis]
MKRPYIICHMLTSLDGKIAGDYLEEVRTRYFTSKYEEIHDRYECKAWICGRITMEKHFTFGNKLDLDLENTPTIPRTDYVANIDAPGYAVAVDPLGKLGWTKNFIEEDEDRFGHHIIEVLTEEVSDAYLNYLQKLGVSYIFGGKNSLNFTVVVEKLKKLFSIDKLLLEGGGLINGSFLYEGLIDELSLVLVPIVDGSSNSLSLFEASAHLPNSNPVNFYLKSVERLHDGGLWMKYKINPMV